MEKKSNGKSLLQRLRFKYKLAILNESTLEEVWRIRLSKLSVITFSFVVAILYFFLIAVLIIKTPLRGFLPGYADNAKMGKELKLTAVQVDSIYEKVQLHTQYISAMRAIVSGEVHVDSTMDKQAMVNVTSNALLEASEREMAFRDSFEAQKVEELSIGIEKDKAVTNYLMHKPANGRIVETFNPHRNAYGLTLSADPNTSVSAILDGVVISCEYSLNDVYILVVQHPDNLTSVYKLHQPYIKKIGDKVNAGEILSTFLKDADTYFEFQLWKEGSPLDPQLFISF